MVVISEEFPSNLFYKRMEFAVIVHLCTFYDICLLFTGVFLPSAFPSLISRKYWLRSVLPKISQLVIKLVSPFVTDDNGSFRYLLQRTHILLSIFILTWKISKTKPLPTFFYFSFFTCCEKLCSHFAKKAKFKRLTMIRQPPGKYVTVRHIS